MGITSWFKAGALVVLSVGLTGCQNDGSKDKSVFGSPPNRGIQSTQNPPSIPAPFPITGTGGMNAGGNTFNSSQPLGGSGGRNLGPSTSNPASFTSGNNFNPPPSPAGYNPTAPGGLGSNLPALPSNNTGIVPGASGVRNNEYYQVPGGASPGNLQPPANNFAPGGLAPLGGSTPPPAPTPNSGGFQVPR